MAKTFVEFYFNCLDLSGKNEREVSSRDASSLTNIPQFATSFRFFEKDSTGKKINFSSFYFLGTKYSIEDFKKKFPQLASDPDLMAAENIVGLNIGGFRPLNDGDIVIS